MKKYWFFCLGVAVLSAAFILSSCGQSPLLNHEKASGQVRIGAPGEIERTANSGDSTQACPLDFPAHGLCASIVWVGNVVADQENEFTLSFWSKARSSSAGPYQTPQLEVGVQLWMPSMGHGSSPVRPVLKEEGVYSAPRVFFLMPGDWDIRVQLKKGRSVVEQAIYPIKI